MGKKCLITYFSQGGTTKRIAGAVCSGLESSGWSVDLMSLDEAAPRVSEISGYDMVGIGSPTYFYQPPFNVSEFIASMPQLSGTAVFSFVLHGTYIGDAGNRIRSAMKEKGASDIGYFSSKGADMFLGYLREGYLFSPDNPSTDEVGGAENFGRELAERFDGKAFDLEPMDEGAAFMNRFERFFLQPFMFKHVYSRFFKVDADKCVNCGLCEKICPTGNITVNGDDLPEWGNNCIGCINCEMKCPVEAISSPFKWPLSRVFLKLNVKSAYSNPGIENVRVVHRNGKVVRAS